MYQQQPEMYLTDTCDQLPCHQGCHRRGGWSGRWRNWADCCREVMLWRKTM